MKGIKAVILAIAAALILKLFIFDLIITQGQSMEPAINDGNVLIISRLRYGVRSFWLQKYIIRWDRPAVGEVVVFYTPTKELAVKRVSQLWYCETSGFNFYAEGDNELSSYDSRSYGPVSQDNIIGRVLGY